MNADVKSKWVAALRSGDYKQGRKRLHSTGPEGEEFCCLGVLCDVLRREGIYMPRITYDANVIGYDGEMGVLPPRAKAHAGLLSANPRIGGWGLAHHNDAGRSFAEIADMIEENL